VSELACTYEFWFTFAAEAADDVRREAFRQTQGLLLAGALHPVRLELSGAVVHVRPGPRHNGPYIVAL